MTSNFQISGKAPDGRIYVIGGDNYDQFSENLIAVFGGESADRIVEDFQFLLDPPSAPAVANAGGIRAGGASPAQSSAGAPVPGAPTCSHGARVFKSGNSAKGPWSAWFCPQPKDSGDQCKAQWA